MSAAGDRRRPVLPVEGPPPAKAGASSGPPEGSDPAPGIAGFSAEAHNVAKCRGFPDCYWGATTETSTSGATRQAPLALRRNFLLLWIGQSVSGFGDALLAVGLLWLVLEMTGSPIKTAATAFFEFLPYPTIGLIAGALVDRWDRRLTMLCADTARAILVLAVPILAAAGALRVWELYAIAFLLPALGRLFAPAKQAFIPDLVGDEDLSRANGISEGTAYAAWIAGPALGGLMVAAWGTRPLFAIDAATFFLSALTLALIRTAQRHEQARGAGMARDIRDGVRHLWSDRVLRQLLLLIPGPAFFFAPIPVLLPIIVRDELHLTARTYGFLTACFFVGLVAAGLLLGKVSARRNGLLMLQGAAVLTVGVALVGVHDATVMAAGLLFCGAGAQLFNVGEFTLLQIRTPPEMRGRAVATANVASQALRTVAVLGAGVVAERWSGADAVRAGAVALAIIALLAWLLAGELRRESGVVLPRPADADAVS